MSEHSITAENLMLTLPPSLRQDKSVLALAEIAAQALTARLDEIDLARLYPAIGRMDEKLLDTLAYDFKCDWWDPDAELDQKRRTMLDNWLVHRHLGTRWAIMRELNNVAPGSNVLEWFEYEGGKPYHFRLTVPVDAPGMTLEKQTRILKGVWYYKNLRSHMDQADFNLAERRDTLAIGTCGAVLWTLEVPEEQDRPIFLDAPKLGSAGSVHIELSVPEKQDEYHFWSGPKIGATSGLQVGLPVPEKRESEESEGA